jgi:translation elongation factor EF-4
LKSLTHGYGSFEYEHNGFLRADIVKLVIHIMNDPVEALSFLVHEKKAVDFGKRICVKMKETIPEQLFTINIQARIGSKTIAK